MRNAFNAALLLLLCFWLAMTGNAAAQSNILNLDISSDRTTASISGGEVITLRIRYTCASTTTAASGAVITLPLGADLNMVALQGSSHTTGTSFTGGNAVFTFVSPLPPGSTGEVFVQTKFKNTTAENTAAALAATFTATNSTAKVSNAVTVTGINAGSGGGTVNPPPVFTPGLKGEKWGMNRITPLGPYLYYTLWHGNTGDAAQPLTNYTIEDNFPANTRLHYFGTEQWQSQAALDVTVYYKTNLNSTWRQWGTGPLYNTSSGRSWFYASELPLTPSLEWVTSLRWSYGTMPGGGDFHPDRINRYLEMALYMANPVDFTAGSIIQNCADYTATGYSARHCADTPVVPEQAEPYLWISDFSPSGGEPYAPGQTIQLQAHFGNHPASNQPITSPTLWFIVPPQFEYNNAHRMVTWATGSLNADPAVTVVKDYGSPGTTLLEFRWPSLTIPNNRNYNECVLELDLKAKATASTAVYAIECFAGWRTPDTKAFEQAYRADTYDVDRDRNLAEDFAYSITSLDVSTLGLAASLTSVMYLRGELDSAWKNFPSAGETVVGGRADYELHLTNTGGVPVKDIMVVDILPGVGDTGVIDLESRGSQWTPFLVDAVSAPAGVTVHYSTSRNPCRPELVASGPPGCEAPGWNSALPEDITSVRSLKFDMSGLVLLPGEKIVLKWPMRAPWGAPTNGEIAWNSAGFTATRSDNFSAMLPSEPAKTGIAIRKPTPPYYGDRVWIDTNRNGIQDSGELGVNGVRVELYRDNGDNVANPMTDTFVSFTATYREGSNDGSYLFGNMGPGNYFALIMAPGESGVTVKDAAGTTNAKDSDGTSTIYRGRRAAIMPVTQLVTNEEDRTWDQGFYPRTNIPAVWAVAQDSRGRNILGGRFSQSHGINRRNIVRVNRDGTVDASFNPGTGFDNTVRALALRDDGMIWAGGNFNNYNGLPSKGVALLTSTGVLDTRPAKPDTNEINWVGSFGNSMYLAGAFGKVGGVACGNVARLKADGTLDTSFNKGAGANGTVYGGAVLSGGSVMLVGAFTSYNGTSRSGVVKIKTDGTVDNSFHPGSGAANGEVYSIKMLEDGRAILTGNFRKFNGVTCNGTVRLKPNGQIDTTMGRSELNVDSINTSN